MTNPKITTFLIRPTTVATQLGGTPHEGGADGGRIRKGARRRPEGLPAHGSGQGGGLRVGRGLHAQNVPCDIRAQVFAADLAAGSALDLRALLGGDRARTRNPLIDGRRRDVEGFGEGYLAAKNLAGFSDCIHAAQFSTANHQ